MIPRILLCATLAICCAATDAIPGRKETLAIMRPVNDWQKANPQMKPNDRNWERGT